jgi:hypothetical protein
VTGQRYAHMLGNFLGPVLACHPVTEETFFSPTIWGYEPHRTRFDGSCEELFPNHVVYRYGDITWPARSPDLSACDFFLWGYLKSQVFKARAPYTVQELKHRIQQEVKRIPVETLQRVMGDVRKRPTECLERYGGNLNDVIFWKLDFCFQCVKWIKLKLKKICIRFYIHCVHMKAFAVHYVFKIARFTDAPVHWETRLVLNIVPFLFQIPKHQKY